MMTNHNISLEELKNIDEVESSGKLFLILLKIMEKLRSPEGCVWDREQDHDSLKKNLIEESYEVVEAIEEKNLADLKEELGDLLLQVVFHSQIGNENGNFNINDVIRAIIKKLVRRHPHVFGGQKVKDSKEVLSNWEAIKKKERQDKKTEDSIFSNIPQILPALHYAFEIQRRAARLGFDWDNPVDVFKKVKEEIKELEIEINNGNSKKIEEELGDLLFSIVNFSRQKSIDCELSLRNTCKKFIKRFDFMEKYARENNLDFKSMPLKEKDKLWVIAKEKLS